MGLLASTLFQFSNHWIPDSFDLLEKIRVRTGVLTLLFYASLGIVTRRWREAAIACFAAMMLQLLQHVTGSIDRPLAEDLLFFIVDPLPDVLFLGLLCGVKKKLWVAYPLLLVAFNIFYTGFYSLDSVSIGVADFIPVSPGIQRIAGIFTGAAAMVCTIIFLCELIHYMQDKADISKTTVLNLNNDYDKQGGIITFWVVKTMLWLFILSAWFYIDDYIRYFSAWRNDNEFITGNEFRFYLITGFINLLAHIAGALLMAVYIRKFLLEYFITYDIKSKFLYWFSLLPVAGFLSFLVMQMDAGKQVKHSEKLASLGRFAASSSTSVTGVFFFLIFLRLIMRIAEGEATFIISLIISILLFVWMTVDKTGFYVNMLLNLVLLIAGVFVVFATSITGEYFGLLFGMVLLNSVHLILLYPVYHIDDFRYVPAEDPDPSEREFHLFKTH
jgi:hypothetical protein